MTNNPHDQPATQDQLEELLKVQDLLDQAYSRLEAILSKEGLSYRTSCRLSPVLEVLERFYDEAITMEVVDMSKEIKANMLG